MTISEPGIYRDIPAPVYHADPCPIPSLSSGMARGLLKLSPRHVRATSRRLNPDMVAPSASDEQDYGTALHALFLGNGAEIEWIDAPDRRKGETKAAIGAARAAGRVPLLARQRKWIETVVEALRTQLREHPKASRAFQDGAAEATMIWREGDEWCRARADWLCDDPRRPIYDLKFTGVSAEPRAWARMLRREGYDVQHAHYTRGAAALRGECPPFRFVVQEWNPPYGMSVLELDAEAIALAERRWSVALARWSECRRTNRWPGYAAEIHYMPVENWQRQETSDIEHSRKPA